MQPTTDPNLMPPRLPADVNDPLNPAEAAMGQTSNGSNKRPRDEEDDDVDDDEEEGGKKERKSPLSLEIARIY